VSGPPPEPNEKKRARGNPGKRPLPTPIAFLAAATTVPPVPEQLAEHGRAVWDRVWTAGQAWIAPATDIELMTRYCEMIDLRDAVREDVLAGDKDVMKLVAVENLLDKMEAKLALNPADRSRVGKAEVERESAVQRLMGAKQGPRGKGPRRKPEPIVDAEVIDDSDDHRSTPAVG